MVRSGEAVWPLAQALHAPAPAALIEVAEHAAQTDWPPLAYVPAPQDVHATALASEKEPAPHGTSVDGVAQKEPAAQAAGTAEPAAQ
jgi:hypothetical protein